MSNVSFVEKLLDGVEVEWKSLGEVATLRRGRVMSKEFLADNVGNFPVYSSQTANNGMIGSIDTFDFNGEFISWTTDGANAGTVFYRTGKFSITNVCGLIKINNEAILNYKYLFYWLTIEAQKHVYSGMGNPKLMSHQVEKIPVPIPCPENPEKSLEIQAEIVRILDAFTAMTAELTAELNMRKTQYNYYREKLLSFADGDVEWKTLGEVAIVQRGASPRPIAKYITSDENGIPWIKIGDTSPGSKFVNETAQKITPEGAKKSRVLSCGDFIISNSMSFGRPYILNIKGAIHDGWASISDFNETLNSDYLYHYLSSHTVQNYWASKINSGSVSNLNADIIKTLPIPIPELATQKMIASTLDKFDALTNSITEGLPREIELRQQQYEYYRDLLLSFPKPEPTQASA
ncbi:restriction endonuclease subunit S [Plesiomonas shigelloides]|uniref:restriction endonuclease subunit S n=1 Tax=Plesiomonas shigelloides TaxID=703 RepID=UPI000D57AA10|nr:restriction endonuclease subunit S [Plesiomonas shigelloides]PVU64945.1 restriction endonuclease subunit S [Plesiomonas shigelloides]